MGILDFTNRFYKYSCIIKDAMQFADMEMKSKTTDCFKYTMLYSKTTHGSRENFSPLTSWYASNIFVREMSFDLSIQGLDIAVMSV